MAVPRLAFDQQLGTTASVYGNIGLLSIPSPSANTKLTVWARNMVQQVKALAT